MSLCLVAFQSLTAEHQQTLLQALASSYPQGDESHQHHFPHRQRTQSVPSAQQQTCLKLQQDLSGACISAAAFDPQKTHRWLRQWDDLSLQAATLALRRQMTAGDTRAKGLAKQLSNVFDRAYVMVEIKQQLNEHFEAGQDHLAQTLQLLPLAYQRMFLQALQQYQSTALAEYTSRQGSKIFALNDLCDLQVQHPVVELYQPLLVAQAIEDHWPLAYRQVGLEALEYWYDAVRTDYHDGQGQSSPDQIVIIELQRCFWNDELLQLALVENDVVAKFRASLKVYPKDVQ